jgi:hypothetical protein|tara:strand:+ start:6699 stop:7016 length:318 start_codon:yes stop_codon:yes gene_type:complete
MNWGQTAVDKISKVLEDRGLKAQSWDDYGTPSVQVIGKERSLITSYEEEANPNWTWQLYDKNGGGKRGTYVYGEYEPTGINDEEAGLKDMVDQIEEVWKFIGEGK